MANTTNKNKSSKAMIRVTTGSRANVFHDQVTGITVVKGDVVELTKAQFRNKRIQTGIASGHLVLVPDEVKQVEKYSDTEIENLTKKVKTLYEQGTTVEKIASSVTLEEAKLIAEANDVTVEKADTVVDILKAVLEE
jgi:hypothetical protein